MHTCADEPPDITSPSHSSHSWEPAFYAYLCRRTSPHNLPLPLVGEGQGEGEFAIQQQKLFHSHSTPFPLHNEPTLNAALLYENSDSL
jgi:hypothetical protein